MAKFGIASGPFGARRKIATAFAAAGALLLSSGMVVAAAPGALAAPGDNSGKAVGADKGNKGKGNNNAGGNGNQGGNNNSGGGTGNQGGGNGGNAGGGGNGGSNANIAICHRRASDKNPYSVMYVAENSTLLEAHRGHQDPASKGSHTVWRSYGTWNGMPYEPGRHKPDYIFGDDNTPDDLNDFVTWCLTPPIPGGSDGEEGELALVVTTASCGRWGAVDPVEATGVNYSIADNKWDGLDGTVRIYAEATEPSVELTTEEPGWVIHPNGRSAQRDVALGEYTDDCVVLAAIEADPIEKCGEWGSVERSGGSSHVTYTINRKSWNGIQGDVTVTAQVTVADLTIDVSNLDSDWNVADDARSAVATFELGKFEKCPPRVDDGEDVSDTLVSPRYPSTTDATCSRNGRLVVPNQPQGVRMERTGSVPGTVTFTFSPAKGFAFPKGTNRSLSLEVEAQLTGGDCIKGVETVRPTPQSGNGPGVQPVNGGTDAEVLGEQAVAVPTAVAAGLGDTMTATTTGSPQLAQALMAGGLLMLVMGGATGLGRRTRGAHES